MSDVDTAHGRLSVSSDQGCYGYTHWSDKPLTPGEHTLKLVPQSIADGWQGFCSCGHWKGFASFYDIDTRNGVIAALTEAHKTHAAA